MAFTETKGRYASYGTVSSIPGEIIDSFWFIIDNQLKGVIPLEPLINFELLNQKGLLSVKFSQPHNPLTITVDFQYPFNNSWPRISMLLIIMVKKPLSLHKNIKQKSPDKILETF